MGPKLGSGNFATVFQAKKKDGSKEADKDVPSEVAIKVIDKSKVEDMNDIQVQCGQTRRRGTIHCGGGGGIDRRKRPAAAA